MIEPPKFAVFLAVVTAHLAVLAFGFPNMRPAPGTESQTTSLSASVTGGDESPQSSGAVPGADSHNRYGADRDPRHSDVSPRPAVPASANSSATRAGHPSTSDSEGSADTVPSLEEHRRQHEQDGRDADSQLVDLERLALSEPGKSAGAELPSGDLKLDESEASDSGQLAAAPQSPAATQLPGVGDESMPSVGARPTPVQMIIPEKPAPINSAAAEPPRARPVANAPQPAAPTSNRAGSSRMKNLRPIKPSPK